MKLEGGENELTHEEMKRKLKQQKYEDNYQYKGTYDVNYKHEEADAVGIKDLQNYKPRKVKR